MRSVLTIEFQKDTTVKNRFPLIRFWDAPGIFEPPLYQITFPESWSLSLNSRLQTGLRHMVTSTERQVWKKSGFNNRGGLIIRGMSEIASAKPVLWRIFGV